MRLLFDARHVAGEYTGLGRYTASLLRTLLETRTARDCEIDVLIHRGVDWSGNGAFRAIERLARAGRCTLQEVPAPPISLQQHWSVSRWLDRRGGDHYFYPHFDPPLGTRIPTSFVVHDVLPLAVRDYVRRLGWAKRRYFAGMIRAAVHRSRHCFAVSETTRADIVRLLGGRHENKVRVAYEAPVLGASDGEATRLPEGVGDQPFLLYVGDRRPHKNVERIVDLYRLLREAHGYGGQLVLAGSTRNHRTDVDAHIGGDAGIRVLGNVTDAALEALYRATDALVFLSRYEGFGLPVLEAARHGRPMLLSDGGSLAEIAPPGACVLPLAMPLAAQAESAARYLEAARRSPPNHDAYLARFSWERVTRTIFPEAYA
jgi:glycosyltransferase involved in cell wall biosynthesis